MRWRNQAPRSFGASSSVSEQSAPTRALARQPDADIGVLGDVPGVPSADAPQRARAEMIGRPAQGDRQAERRQPGIDQVEQRRVFDREHLADPRVADIADRQARLQAVEAGVADEMRRREA
jgi:hypothetical protein